MNEVKDLKSRLTVRFIKRASHCRGLDEEQATLEGSIERLIGKRDNMENLLRRRLAVPWKTERPAD
jgi:hypothetical protein